MFQANDKDTLTILTEAVLVFFAVNLEHAIVSWGVFKINLPKEF